VRVFKVKRLSHWAKNEGLSDQALCMAAREVAEGKAEANLGQNLFKKRIPRPGMGKSSGFRTIVAFKSNNSSKIFFLYGFAKNDRSNISHIELDGLALVARAYLGATEKVLASLLGNGELIEIEENTDERHT